MSKQKRAVSVIQSYDRFATDIQQLLAEARRQAARSVNAVMTAVYWEIGRRIVEYEQQGKERADYGEELLIRLSADLTDAFGRGFGVDNLQRMRAFFLACPPDQIYATVSRKSSAWPAPLSAPEKYAAVSRISAETPILSTASRESATAKKGTLSSGYEIPQTVSGKSEIQQRTSAQCAVTPSGKSSPASAESPTLSPNLQTLYA
ncbi:MAG: DUF1016 domain-containing protein, partial [Planctomycetes bacterium]|nr:DUF1016 domain-containing protein [Planctomycetota bacterium]